MNLFQKYSRDSCDDVATISPVNAAIHLKECLPTGCLVNNEEITTELWSQSYTHYIYCGLPNSGLPMQLSLKGVFANKMFSQQRRDHNWTLKSILPTIYIAVFLTQNTLILCFVSHFKLVNRVWLGEVCPWVSVHALNSSPVLGI